MTPRDEVAGLVNTSVDDCRVSLKNLLSTDRPDEVIGLCLGLLQYLDSHNLEHITRRRVIFSILERAKRAARLMLNKRRRVRR